MSKIKKYFWNDSDGYTAQNHALVLFTTPFALMWIIASVMALFGIPIDPTFMNLMSIMETPMLVVLGGIFSINVATEIRKPREANHTDYEREQKQDYYNDRI